jgi:hypothetical protein
VWLVRRWLCEDLVVGASLHVCGCLPIHVRLNEFPNVLLAPLPYMETVWGVVVTGGLFCHREMLCLVVVVSDCLSRS